MANDREEREQRRVKKLASKDLPYSLDSAKLLDMVPELDRDKGLGRVLRDVIEATQGNFDHMRSELKRQTDYHNEHAEETNFIKDEVIPHEHPGYLPKGGRAGYDDFDLPFDDGHWILPNAHGGGTFAGVDAYGVPTFIPVFIDKPCTIKQLRFEVTALPSGGGPQQDVKMAIYAGDGDGNFPDTLLLDVTSGGNVICSSTGYKTTDEFDLEVGPGWLWFALCTTRTQLGTDLTIWSWDKGWTYDPDFEFAPQGHFPFPVRLFDLDTGFTGHATALMGFFDPRDIPAPADPWPTSYMDDLNNNQFLSTPFYDSYGPVIEYRTN